MQGIVWILFFYLLGCVVAALTGNFIPGSVVGMLLLFAALSFGWIRPWRMKRAAGFLLDNMMLFFIPVGVGLIASYSLVSKYLTIFSELYGSASLQIPLSKQLLESV